jgi:hypothetical protein
VSKAAGWDYLLVRNRYHKRLGFVVPAIVFTSAAVCGIVFINFSDKNEFIQVSQAHISSA